MDRIEQLKKFIDQAPDEPFPRYALALELKGRGEADAAAAELGELVRRAPDYLAAYLQLGMLLQVLGRTSEARKVFEGGQEVARKKGDSHTLSELTQALDAL
jgi:tetratricopeptide (TPR) repeat protein